MTAVTAGGQRAPSHTPCVPARLPGKPSTSTPAGCWATRVGRSTTRFKVPRVFRPGCVNVPSCICPSASSLQKHLGRGWQGPPLHTHQSERNCPKRQLQAPPFPHTCGRVAKPRLAIQAPSKPPPPAVGTQPALIAACSPPTLDRHQVAPPNHRSPNFL